MLTFARAEIFVLALLLPLLAWLAFRHRQRQQVALRRIGNANWLRTMQGSRMRHIWQNFLWLAALGLVLLAWAGPQWGRETRLVASNGLQMMVLLDLSQSMLAEDVSENRLLQARKIMASALDSLAADDEVGLMVYAGETRLLVPLTPVLEQVRQQLEQVGPADMLVQGTVLAAAIETAAQAFPYPRSGQPIQLILSDGEDHGGEVLHVAREAAAQDIMIITIGIGSETGAPVPMIDEAGQIAGSKLDGAGEPVISRLNSETLQQIATAGNGRYLSGEDAAETLPAYLDEIRATHTGSQMIIEPIERYQLFLLTAVLLLVLSPMALSKNSGSTHQNDG